MAKIIIAGNAVVVTSGIKLADYRKIAKYRPKALVLMGGEDNKEQIFRVGVVDEGGSIRKYGIEFGSATNDDEKLASITIVNPAEGGANIKEAVAESIGPAVMLLNKLEETLPAVIDEIDAEKAAILDNITVAQ